MAIYFAQAWLAGANRGCPVKIGVSGLDSQRSQSGAKGPYTLFGCLMAEGPNKGAFITPCTTFTYAARYSDSVAKCSLPNSA